MDAAWCMRYELKKGQEIYGDMKYATYQKGEDLLEFARKYDVAYDVLVQANPVLNQEKVPANTVLILPRKFILPNVPRKGIVINVAERRIYYFEPNGKYFHTFPVSVGRDDKETPLGVYKIIQKKRNPVWYVPKSLYDEGIAKGIDMPKYVLPGEDNPLGKYMMRLSSPSYLIHGTNAPERIGRRQTAGCISLYPEDIKVLFNLVPLKEQVRIINQPVKMVMINGVLVVESHNTPENWKHPFFSDPSTAVEDRLHGIYIAWKKRYHQTDAALMQVIKEQAGIPREVKERKKRVKRS